ncbi:GatB/YqeY domain-containing protein [Abyssisolibacter fermentans]|uniref:GatB/YqeY domain-containing protein n=1 Tax=Abyssisolibacter fermentans TaxID=1766203 RepID=UPI00083318AC|nr:GatB/YqeY domain-containing protein [Abyssisolibacter fermentans]
MSLKEKLMDDLKQSMRQKNKLRKNAITMVRAGIKQKEVDERIQLNDEQIIEIISKQVKQKKDSIESFEKGGRDDLVENTKKEIEILMEYLPEQLSNEEIEAIVKEVVHEVNATSMKDMGKIMGKLMPRIKGRADGSVVNSYVKQILG